jgi:hypothetical protein
MLRSSALHLDKAEEYCQVEERLSGWLRWGDVATAGRLIPHHGSWDVRTVSVVEGAQNLLSTFIFRPPIPRSPGRTAATARCGAPRAA